MHKSVSSHFKEDKIRKSFGLLPNGKEVFCYTLTNKNGIELEIINYGATIKSLKIPISKLKKINIVLGFENLSDYINSFELPSAPYFGSVVGRFAGRINNGEFVLNGKTIQLTKNHKLHQLHGGIDGFSKAYWELESIETSNHSAITLHYTSNNNEENFPGKVTTEIKYTLTDENELKIEMKATSSEDTIINLTQHSYFNLDGHSNTIANQELHLNSSKTLETNFDNIPTGRFFDTTNTPFNFKNPKKCPTKIDNTFVLDKKNEIAASLYSEENKIKMTVYTNQPAIHIYVGGNCFNKIKGPENTNYHSQSGICFETQNFPDAPNHSHFPNAVLKKDETYIHNTTFKFETL